ncbi:hypothetical protein BKA57DRAFT_454406 [Linnemannia elongata]|nr:hypothetical protein BKA57DRAFT_454406 [Linnemannia elongata]
MGWRQGCLLSQAGRAFVCFVVLCRLLEFLGSCSYNNFGLCTVLQYPPLSCVPAHFCRFWVSCDGCGGERVLGYKGSHTFSVHESLLSFFFYFMFWLVEKCVPTLPLLPCLVNRE